LQSPAGSRKKASSRPEEVFFAIIAGYERQLICAAWQKHIFIHICYFLQINKHNFVKTTKDTYQGKFFVCAHSHSSTRVL
jgi:hypothetical protein